MNIVAKKVGLYVCAVSGGIITGTDTGNILFVIISACV